MSGKRDSNPRPSAWEADALPLSYFRVIDSFESFQSKNTKNIELIKYEKLIT